MGKNVKIALQSAISALLMLLAFGSAGSASSLEVFVSVPPQKWLSDQLGKGLVITNVLVNKGQDPHTFEPTPKQIASLSRSKIYFTIGMEFEQQITRKLGTTISELAIIDSTRQIDRIAFDAHERLDEAATDRPENHNHGGDDPHVWLSPVNLIKIAEVMAEAMIQADPGNAETYRKNLQQTTSSLIRIHRQIAADLAPFRGSSFYVFHPSFGYFAKEYGLHQEAVEIAGKSPSPKQLSSLIAKAKTDKVRIIFVQPQFDTKSAIAVAKAIEGVVEPLDALAEDVAANLQTMASRIKTALATPARLQP